MPSEISALIIKEINLAFSRKRERAAGQLKVYWTTYRSSLSAGFCEEDLSDTRDRYFLSVAQERASNKVPRHIEGRKYSQGSRAVFTLRGCLVILERYFDINLVGRERRSAKMPRCYMVKKALCNKYITSVARGFENWGRGRSTPSPTTTQPVSPVEGCVASSVAQGTPYFTVTPNILLRICDQNNYFFWVNQTFDRY